VKLSLAGIGVSVGPDEVLNSNELAMLDRLAGPGGGGGEGRPALTLEVEQAEPVAEGSDTGPAQVVAQGGQILLRHGAFSAEFEPLSGLGRLLRATADADPLTATLRTALCCRLPALGGLALHAAGLVVDGMGVAFFGRSGAGKSTLAGVSPYPVLSDELVSVTGPPWRLHASGFWGDLGPVPGSPSGAALGALVALAKGPQLELERLGETAAFRLLIHTIQLSTDAGLWQRATTILARIVQEVPVWRMAWVPGSPPWASVRSLLGGSCDPPPGRAFRR
jgi:hypothetical protein